MEERELRDLIRRVRMRRLSRRQFLHRMSAFGLTALHLEALGGDLFLTRTEMTITGPVNSANFRRFRLGGGLQQY